MIAFICCSATSGFVLKVSMNPRSFAVLGTPAQAVYARRVRVGVLVLALLLAAGSPAVADRLEASGFVGVGYFSDNTELGNSWAPEQVPGSAPLVGGRVGWIARDWRRAQLAVEAELAIATAFTGDGGGRMSYFAPVFG